MQCTWPLTPESLSRVLISATRLSRSAASLMNATPGAVEVSMGVMLISGALSFTSFTWMMIRHTDGVGLAPRSDACTSTS